MQKSLGCQVKRSQSGSGGKYPLRAFGNYLLAREIQHITFAPY